VRKVGFLIVAIAALTASSASTAQPVWSWTGYYVGLNAGYSFGQGDGSITLGSGFSTDVTPSLDGFIGGGQFGYNWQTANWVYGIETDFQGTAQKGSASAICPGGTTNSVNGLCTPGHVGDTINDPARPVSVDLTERLEWLGTFRARFGSTITPTTLVYITGGVAYGGIKVSETVSGINVNGVNGANGATFTPGGGASSETHVHAGWTVGAGFESVLWQNWTARVEYLYIDLGTVSGSFATSLGAVGGGSLVAGYSAHVTDNIVRFAINYVFH
jgi:outer membrane immunogenic protein